MAKARAVSIQMLMWTRHNGNALHIYCRLVDFGFSKKWAARLAKGYEFLTKNILY